MHSSLLLRAVLQAAIKSAELCMPADVLPLGCQGSETGV